MKNLITFDKLRSVILRQGIVTMPHVWPEADFRKDLHYKSGDLLEFAWLIDQTFQIPLSREQAGQLTTVRETIGLLNRIGQLLDLVERLN